MGWELFKNYLIAKEKFQPNFFLYENNKSASDAIKSKIKEEFGVFEQDSEQQEGQLDLFSDLYDTGVRYIEINSALVSAQNRQRFYVHNCGDVQQPEDRHILLKDILETGFVDREKSRALLASAGRETEREYFKKHQGQVVLEQLEEAERIPSYGIEDKARPVNALYGKNAGCGEGSLENRMFNPNQKKQQVDYIAEPVKCLTEAEMDYMVRDHQEQRWLYMNKPAEEDKSHCVVANIAKGVPYNVLAEPVNITDDGKSQTIKAQYYKNGIANFVTNTQETTGSSFGATGVAEPIPVNTINDEGEKSRTLMSGYYKYGTATMFTNDGFKGGTTAVAEPVRVGTMPTFTGKHTEEIIPSQANRVYSSDGKATTISTGQYKTGSYAIPVMSVNEATSKGTTDIEPGDCVDLGQIHSPTRRGRNMKDKCNCLTTSDEYYQYLGTKQYPIYEVRDGKITIKGKQYPIKLLDGFYIIRKLTVTECCRLQTMPDDYCKAVSDSQAYKGLGNGWTAEVIIHILNGALKNVPRDEEIVVLSMYDGIGTGRYVLDKMGFKNVKYYAYEIDKYAMQISHSNYPDIIQCGDAFQLRNDDWHLPE